jgi:hypothetical protein
MGDVGNLLLRPGFQNLFRALGGITRATGKAACQR